MGAKISASLCLLLFLSLFFFALTTTACNTCGGIPTPTTPTTPIPKTPTTPIPKTPSGPRCGGGSSCPTCPRDALKFGVCVNLLNGLLGVVIGTPPVQPCCSCFQGLVDLEAAVCLCTAIKANVLGIGLDVPLCLKLLLNACGMQVPGGFQCA
ncbi:hypothetical protein Ancab_032468 [Ancistrocladus abbreviatus]